MKPWFTNLKLYWTLLALLCSMGAAAAVNYVASDDARVASKAFFEDNAGKEGVVSLPSGLQYRVLNPGKGAKPRAIDTVTLHYRGTTLDGTEVDSTYGGAGPASMRVAQTMPGWREALLLMEEGAKWELFIPPGLGYTRQRGSNYSRRGKLPGEPLVFQLELLEVKRPDKSSFASLASRGVQRGASGVPHVFVYLMGDSSPEPEAARGGDQAPLAITTESLAPPTLADAAAGAGQAEPAGGTEAAADQAAPPAVAEAVPEAAEAPAAAASQPAVTPAAAMFDDPAMQAEVTRLPNGLKYRVVRRGDGAAPAPADTITVHYRGSLVDGREFDSSYRQGKPVSFRLDEAIPGWQALLQRMQAGASWILYIPPEMAYRKPGPLAGLPLIFEVELLAVSEAESYPGAAAESRAEADQQLAIDLASGISYRVLRNGGGLAPLAGDTVSLEYRERPRAGQQAQDGPYAEGQVTLPLDWLIPAWRSVLTRMEEGARWEVRIPPELVHAAWLRRARQPVTLELELLSVSPAAAEGIAFASLELGARRAATAGAPDTAVRQEHRVLRAGTGDRPQADDRLTLRYRATLPDGRGLGHTWYDEGQVTLRLDEAQPLWRQALSEMRQGSHWELAVASERLPATWAPLSGQAALLELELLAIEPAAGAPATAP